MRCDTCGQESPAVMRVIVAKDYNRSLARPIFNCPSCFEKKEQEKTLRAQGSGLPGPSIASAGAGRAVTPSQGEQGGQLNG